MSATLLGSIVYGKNDLLYLDRKDSEWIRKTWWKAVAWKFPEVWLLELDISLREQEAS